jgi:5-methylcytosine-specific restriction endonuclease McrA
MSQRELDRRYRQRHPTKVRERKQVWVDKNRTRVLENARCWREANPDNRKATLKRWSEAHPGVAATRATKWNADHPERARENQRRYRRQNPELGRIRVRRRRALKAAAVGHHTAAQVQARWDFYGGMCWMCGDPAEAMDHVIALARGGPNWAANLRPACKECNSSKGTKKVSTSHSLN